MPEAVVRRLKDLVGLDYVEGYGLSETMAATHLNPPQRPKPQCLGIPVFDGDARIVDPDTLREVPRGESGEVVVHGPQVMQRYWNNPDATAAAFGEIDGKRFLRTGDLARIAESRGPSMRFCAVSSTAGMSRRSTARGRARQVFSELCSRSGFAASPSRM
jgi:fatty-acyl-CoA synthase